MRGGPTIKALDELPSQEMWRFEFDDGRMASIWEKWIEVTPRFSAFWNTWDPGAMGLDHGHNGDRDSSPGWYEVERADRSLVFDLTCSGEDLVQTRASVEADSDGRGEVGAALGDRGSLVLVQEVAPRNDLEGRQLRRGQGLSGMCLADLQQRVQQNRWAWSASGDWPTQTAP